VMYIILQLFIIFTSAEEMMQILARAEQERQRIANMAPPEAESLTARRSRLVNNINLAQSEACQEIYLAVARKALARTFAIYCAKAEKRPLGKTNVKILEN